MPSNRVWIGSFGVWVFLGRKHLDITRYLKLFSSCSDLFVISCRFGSITKISVKYLYFWVRKMPGFVWLFRIQIRIEISEYQKKRKRHIKTPKTQYILCFIRLNIFKMTKLFLISIKKLKLQLRKKC